MKETKTLFEPEKPVVPNKWEIAPFQKVVSVLPDKGKRIKQRSYLLEGNIPVIDQGQDFVGGYTNDEKMKFDGELPVILFGDHTRAIKYVNKPFAVGAEGIKILKPDNCYDYKFFYYLLNSLQIPSRGYSRHFQFLKKFYLPVAPISEQKNIVSEIEKQFSRLDEAVAVLKRIKANLKRYKVSVLKTAVEGKLTAEWRKQHPDVEPASVLLERILVERRRKWEENYPKKKYKEPFKPYAINFELPEKWTLATIQQLAELVQYGSSSKTIVDLTGIPILRMGNIFEGELILNSLKYLPKDHPEFPELLLNQNDLLFNRTNSPELVGKTAVYKNKPKPCSFASYLIRVRLNNDIDPNFISYYLNSMYGRMWIKSVVSQQVGQANVNGTKLQAVTIPLPPPEEQQEIVSAVEHKSSVFNELERELEKNIKRAERLHQSILKKAFSGRLVSKVAVAK